MNRFPLRSTLRRLYRTVWPPHPVRRAYLTDAFPEVSPTTLMEGEYVPTPETAMMDIDPFAGYVKSPAYWAPSVTTAPLSQALYCPVNNCVLNQDREVVRESTGPGARAAGLNGDALATSNVDTLDGVWTALRCPFNDFYHFLVDNLSRLDMLHHSFFDAFGTINVFCPGGPTPLEAYFVEKLNLPNIRLVDVDRDRLYQPDTYLFTSFLTKRASGYVRGPFVERLRAAVRPSAVPESEQPPSERIYISRRGADSRRVLNEEALMDALRPLGFTCYQMETLCQEEQIRLFVHAECVVSPHGAGLTNLLFSPSASVIELFGSRYVVPHYYLLTKALGLRYQHVCYHSDDRNADMYVEVDHIRHLVERELHRTSSSTDPSAAERVAEDATFPEAKGGHSAPLSSASSGSPVTSP